MSTPEIREAVKDFVQAVDMADMQELARRQHNALEAITALLYDVTGMETGPGEADYGRGYIAGQKALARRVLEAIVREVRE